MRAAVVGTGFGCRVHVPALRAAGFDIVALVGQDPARTRRRADRAEIDLACTSLADAIAIGIDAVTIATPPDTHAPLVLEAVAAGLPVLCEKPFARTVAEAETMHRAAEKAKVVGLVAHEFRFAAERMAVARLIGDGAVGTPRLATFVQQIALVADRATPVPGWWYDAERGGGWLLASGSHAVDQARHWLGEVAAVRSSALLHRGDDADDSFVAHLAMASGCEVTIVQSASAWGPPLSVARVVGENGSVWIDGGVWLADPTHPGGRLVEPPVVDEANPDPRHRFTHIELAPFTELCRRFAAAIEHGDSDGAATFADGLATQRVLDAIRVT